MADEIKLTHEELEEIKDTITFRTKTTLILKNLKNEVDKLCTLKGNIATVTTYQKIQWWFIGGIIMSILGLAFKVIAFK